MPGVKAVVALTVACAFAGAAVVAFGPDANAQGGCQPGDTMVSIDGNAYSPSSVTVAPGSSVCWTNDDPYEHTVTSVSPGFDSGQLVPGQTFRHMFSGTGTFGYYCAVPSHNMAGTVVVSAGQPPPPPPPGPPPPGPPPPPPPRQTVSSFRVRVVHAGGRRWLVARATVTRAAPARLQLLRRNRTVATNRAQFRPGRNQLRLLLRRTLPRGRYVARLTVGGAARPYTARIAVG